MTDGRRGQGDFRGHSPRFQGENLQKNLALAEALRAAAEALGLTPAQAAIAWVAAPRATTSSRWSAPAAATAWPKRWARWTRALSPEAVAAIEARRAQGRGGRRTLSRPPRWRTLDSEKALRRSAATGHRGAETPSSAFKRPFDARACPDVHALLHRASRGQGAGDAEGVPHAHGGDRQGGHRPLGRRLLLPVPRRPGEGREEPRQVRPGLRPRLQGPGEDGRRRRRRHPGRVAEEDLREVPHRGGEGADRGHGRLRQADGGARRAHARSRRSATRRATR